MVGPVPPARGDDYPVSGALLYATFLQVPFTKVAQAFRDARILASVLVVNFVMVPLLVAAMTALVSLERAVLLRGSTSDVRVDGNRGAVQGFQGGSHARLTPGSTRPSEW